MSSVIFASDSRREVTINGVKLNLGDRLKLSGRHFRTGIYALTYIHPKVKYVGMHWSPRPGMIGRMGFGLPIADLKDCKIYVVQQHGVEVI